MGVIGSRAWLFALLARTMETSSRSSSEGAGNSASSAGQSRKTTPDGQRYSPLESEAVRSTPLSKTAEPSVRQSRQTTTDGERHSPAESDAIKSTTSSKKSRHSSELSVNSARSPDLPEANPPAECTSKSFHRLSAHPPLIPKRYVPPWQLDMKNRTLITQVTNNQNYC